MRVDRVRDARRLAALRDTGLLDDGVQPSLERLNRLANEMLGVPVSLVSLVDEDRQFFAGQAGLPEPWASIGETPLSHSFCQHVVRTDEPLVVTDARTDPRVRDNLAIRDLGVVAYAGVPLRMPSGEALGSFCAIDGVAREWSAEDMRVLQDFSALAVELIELHRARATDPLHDQLTGLPARGLFSELTERALADAQRDGTAVAMLAVDLDGFRLVNEALGHATGDRILAATAERLSAQARDTDAVCRLGADEFAILCTGVADEQEALVMAKRIRQTLISTPYAVDGTEHSLSATIGIVVVNGGRDAMGADELVQAASAALHNAKANALRGAHEAADPTLGQRAVTSLQTRGTIAGAHERGEMRLDYQPVVDLASGQIRGCEALLRWDHPELGPVPPDEFIPHAERSGAIVALGEWVVRRACADLAAWRAAGGGDHLTVGVNVAPVQLRSATFVDVVAGALRDTGLPASALVVEITERTLLDDRALYRETLQALRELGVTIALDDFGTGYSALGYLIRLPIDLVKLDRSFVAGVVDDPRSAALVKGLVGMTDGLGMRSLAEGIETAEQLEALRALGCELGQGWHLGRPASAEAIAALLDAPAA